MRTSDEDLLEANSPEQLKALSHPARHQLLRALSGGAATVSQLSHRLHTNKGNVAHHLKVLVDAGLVRRGASRTVRGGTEQYFERAARRIRFGAGAEGAATRAMLGTIAAEIPAGGDPLLNHRVIRMTEQQAAALTTHLERVVNDLEPAPEPENEYGVLVALYRRAESTLPRTPPAGE